MLFASDAFVLSRSKFRIIYVLYCIVSLLTILIGING